MYSIAVDYDSASVIIIEIYVESLIGIGNKRSGHPHGEISEIHTRGKHCVAAVVKAYGACIVDHRRRLARHIGIIPVFGTKPRLSVGRRKTVKYAACFGHRRDLTPFGVGDVAHLVGDTFKHCDSVGGLSVIYAPQHC